MSFKMLIVDDEPIICRGLKDTIPWEKYNIEVIDTAHDGQDAILKVQNHANVDLVITDVRMPNMDGLQLTSFIHRNYPNIRMIMVSGYDEFSYAQKAIQLGVKDYLLKPVNIEELVSRVIKLTHEIENEKKLTRMISNLHTKENVNIAHSAAIKGKLNLGNIDKTDWLIGKAEEYIKEYYKSNIRAHEVADIINISPNYFSSLFNQQTGKSFNEYINDLRIEEAKTLLIETPFKVHEIAELVGFKEYKYFVKVFKEFSNLTPMKYRKLMMTK